MSAFPLLPRNHVILTTVVMCVAPVLILSVLSFVRCLPRALVTKPVHLCRVLIYGERCPSALSSGGTFCRGVVSGSSGLRRLSAVHPVTARPHGLCNPVSL